jgi:hypothetical protein
LPYIRGIRTLQFVLVRRAISWLLEDSFGWWVVEMVPGKVTRLLGRFAVDSE